MRRRYKSVRVPIEAYENFGNKKNIIEQILKEEKIYKKFTLADTMRYLSQKKLFIYNDEVVNFLKNKKNRGESSRII